MSNHYIWQDRWGRWAIARGREKYYNIPKAVVDRFYGWESWTASETYWASGEVRTTKVSKRQVTFRVKQNAIECAKHLFPIVRANGIEERPYKRRRLTKLPSCLIEVTRPSELNETNDCTVVALMQVTGVPYLTAHLHAENHGRERRKGFQVWRLWPKGTALGHRFTRLETDTHAKACGYQRWASRFQTIDEFVAANPVGTFYVCTHGHAFSIYDGMIFDYKAYAVGRARITDAWKVEKIS